MSKDLNKLKELRNKFIKYYENSTIRKNVPAAKVSDFWKRVHSSTEKKGGDLFIPEKALSDIGDWTAKGRTMGLPRGNKKNWFDKSIKRVEAGNIPFDFINSLIESEHLLNDKFEHPKLDGKYSGYFILNAGTAYGFTKYLDRYFDRKSPLKIAEIGSGLGDLSYMLMQLYNINKYTYIDLAPTALLCMLNILQIYEDDHELIDKEHTGNCKLNWCIPENLEFIDDKFDVIINVASLQEMSLDNVNSYIDWVKAHLSENGIFISMNHYERGEVTKAREYRFHEFDILEMDKNYRRLTNGLVDVVMKLKTDSKEYDLDLLDEVYHELVKNKPLNKDKINKLLK